VRGIPGFIKVVSKGNYVAVVCEREEQAIAAQRQIKVNWEKPATARSPTPKTYSNTCVRQHRLQPKTHCHREPGSALANAAKVVEAEYDVPFQGHTAISPAHALADPSNGQMTIYSNDMKSYGMRTGVAEFLQMPRDRVRVVWMEGPQAYGRTAADDAGFEAAYLAKEIGRPVRVQWMRQEETAGTRRVLPSRSSCGEDWMRREISSHSTTILKRQITTTLVITSPIPFLSLSSWAAAVPCRRRRRGHSNEMYAIPNRRMASSVVSLPTYLGNAASHGNLRDPNGPQVTFASESFIDELAVAAKTDPLEFRMKLLNAGTTDDNAFRRARSIANAESGRRSVWLGCSSFAQAPRHGEHSYRTRCRLHVPQRNRSSGDRRS
jgi:CO/xanthine dehydrogenase Mo-binding subunit